LHVALNNKNAFRVEKKTALFAGEGLMSFLLFFFLQMGKEKKLKKMHELQSVQSELRCALTASSCAPWTRCWVLLCLLENAGIAKVETFDSSQIRTLTRRKIEVCCRLERTSKTFLARHRQA
jgi:hypothetical protein